jgi:hypothetical protein
LGSTPGSAQPQGNTTVAPTVAQFLLDFPEFDVQGVPVLGASSVAYWLNFATTLLVQARWGSFYYYAVELFVAHNLSLEWWATQGGPGTVPGISKGPIAGTAAGNVSVSYNTAAVLELDAGHWAYTIYGIRLLRYIRMAGAGPLYLGAGGCWGNNAVSSGGWFSFVNACEAWNGPPVYQFPNMSGSG